MDPRMTEETKNYVKLAADAVKEAFSDPISWREVENEIDFQKNSKVEFETVYEKDFLVQNDVDKYRIPVTAFIPPRDSQKASIVVFFHGGGFKLTTTQTYKRSLCYLADRTKKIWISVDYRLAPQSKYPTQLQDCLSAVKWIKQNKSKYFADSDCRIGLCGDSAGGNLAVLVAQELGKAISFQVLVYPWLNLTLDSESHREFSKSQYIYGDGILKQAASEYINKDISVSSPLVSPLFNDNVKGSPKTLVVLAELDPLFDDGATYHKKLLDAGVKSELYVVKGSVHGFFHSYFDYKNAFIDCADEVVKFLKSC